MKTGCIQFFRNAENSLKNGWKKLEKQEFTHHVCVDI